MTPRIWQVTKELADGSFRTVGTTNDAESARFFRDSGYEVIGPRLEDRDE